MHPIAPSNTSLRLTPPEDVARVAGVTWRCALDIASPRRAAAAMAGCRGRVLLIAEGATIAATERGMDAWAEVVAARASRVLLYGPDADALAERLTTRRDPTMVVRCSDLLDATQAASYLSARGGTVLLAVPARSSHGVDETVARYRAAVGALAMAEQPMEVA